MHTGVCMCAHTRACTQTYVCMCVHVHKRVCMYPLPFWLKRFPLFLFRRSVLGSSLAPLLPEGFQEAGIYLGVVEVGS